jgi:hypothetical protein
MLVPHEKSYAHFLTLKPLNLTNVKKKVAEKNKELNKKFLMKIQSSQM